MNLPPGRTLEATAVPAAIGVVFCAGRDQVCPVVELCLQQRHRNGIEGSVEGRHLRVLCRRPGVVAIDRGKNTCLRAVICKPVGYGPRRE